MFRVAPAFSLAAPAKAKAPRLQGAVPPSFPPKKIGYGTYCIRAEAAISDGDVEKGCMRGYGDSIGIATRVKDACDRIAPLSGYTCGDASVVILTNIGDAFVCDGVFLELGEDRRRLV